MIDLILGVLQDMDLSTVPNKNGAQRGSIRWIVYHLLPAAEALD